jgi:2-amino-4-hydroxy-6-hydroxymethyldihydropteridine diphosphokinase
VGSTNGRLRAGTACAVVALGSNLEGPADQVRRALRTLAALPGTDLVRHSALYRSPPLGPSAQPDYVNAVARLRTELSPRALLSALRGIESSQGRTRQGPRWGARTLDLDLLLYDRVCIREVDLTVPHPRMHERAFVLYPLHEVAPHAYIPGRGPLVELLEQVPAHGLRIHALE